MREALARADALRERLQQALKDARPALTSAEDVNQQLHRELALMTTARGRRVLVVRAQNRRRRAATRDPASDLDHGHGRARRRCRIARRRAARRALDYLRAPRVSAAPHGTGDGAGPTVRMNRSRSAGSVRSTFGTGSREALLCHPAGRCSSTARASGRARGSSATARSRRRSGRNSRRRVEFTVAVEIPSQRAGAARSRISIDPGARWTDRRWHTLAVDMPPGGGAALDVVVTLSHERRRGRQRRQRVGALRRATLRVAP